MGCISSKKGYPQPGLPSDAPAQPRPLSAASAAAAVSAGAQFKDISAQADSTFSNADKDGNGQLTLKEIKRLVVALNASIPNRTIKDKFTLADKDGSGSLSRSEFITFFKTLHSLPDVRDAFLSADSGGKGYLTATDLQDFVRSSSQGTQSISLAEAGEMIGKQQQSQSKLLEAESGPGDVREARSHSTELRDSARLTFDRFQVSHVTSSPRRDDVTDTSTPASRCSSRTVTATR